jgi:DNA-binding PadR family transcriptional regulator
MTENVFRHFFAGFVRLHILYHADKHAVCGAEIIEELKRHGYDLSPGTLYPILRSLSDAGYVEWKNEVVNGKRRKNYRITANGRQIMNDAREKVRELVGELIKDRDKMAAARKLKDE